MNFRWKSKQPIVEESLQVFGGAEASTAEAAKPESEDCKDEEQSQSPGGLGKVKTAVFRKAGDLREGLRNRLQEDPKAEAFWTLPSTRANYAELVPAPTSREAVNRVRSLGGKLRGSLARKGREVSSGVASIAQGVRQKGQSLKETVGAGLPAPQKSDSGSALDDANLGDSIFAIGSDEEDAWSDADGFWEGQSDGNSSETPSTRSMSALATAGITSEAGSAAEGAETEHKDHK